MIAMKVLLSAFACLPEHGSEPEIGFQALLAAASRHEVWLLTQPHMAERVEEWLYRPQNQQLRRSIHVHAVEPNHAEHRPGLINLAQRRRRSEIWQRNAAKEALRLDAEVGFDLLHHATLAAFWLRAGIAELERPFVWGPVGGGVETPRRLLRELGWRGLMEDSVRVMARRAAVRTPAVRKAQSRAAVALAQNPETAARIHTPGRLQVLSNGLAATVRRPAIEGSRTRDVLFVGRLVAWKGPMLALRAFRYVRSPDANLRFCGNGGERLRLERAAARWGLRDRVRFEGEIPQADLFQLLGRASAILQPSLHDEGGNAVAETLQFGTPLVCLDHGGPGVIARHWPNSPSTLVPANLTRESTARALAAAVDSYLEQPAPIPTEAIAPDTSFAAAILDSYEEALRPGSR
jgi:glycosyltransferase involved in cell wall biosynthesis